MFLTVQRHHLEHHPQERQLVSLWQDRIRLARSQGVPVIFVQWDGDLFPPAPGSDPAEPGETATFSRGWVLHPDIRAEDGDLLVRASDTNPFAALDLEGRLLADLLREQGLCQLELLALPDSAEVRAAVPAALELGLDLRVVEHDLPAAAPAGQP